VFGSQDEEAGNGLVVDTWTNLERFSSAVSHLLEGLHGGECDHLWEIVNEMVAVRAEA
jgi:hypothetical protein